MTWVRKTPVLDPDQHRCAPPMRLVTYALPGFNSGQAISYDEKQVAGSFGDLWRCDDCGELWRIGNSCDDCDPRPPGGRCMRGGYHPGGLAWRPATWWQRFRNRKKVAE